MQNIRRRSPRISQRIIRDSCRLLGTSHTTWPQVREMKKTGLYFGTLLSMWERRQSSEPLCEVLEPSLDDLVEQTSDHESVLSNLGIHELPLLPARYLHPLISASIILNHPLPATRFLSSRNENHWVHFEKNKKASQVDPWMKLNLTDLMAHKIATVWVGIIRRLWYATRHDKLS